MDLLALAKPVTEFSVRQREVLDAALALMVEAGEGITMNAVAARANCSKETLYKWFGDRDGLLTATVQWQASKVRIEVPKGETIGAAALHSALTRFAENWLTVLTGDISIALNRLAASSNSDLGRIVLNNGPFAMAARLKPLLDLGRRSGVLAFDDLDQAFRVFFGLVVRDVQIRALLGDAISPALVDIKNDARQATERFFTLYGVENEE